MSLKLNTNPGIMPSNTSAFDSSVSWFSRMQENGIDFPLWLFSSSSHNRPSNRRKSHMFGAETLSCPVLPSCCPSLNLYLNTVSGTDRIKSCSNFFPRSFHPLLKSFLSRFNLQMNNYSTFTFKRHYEQNRRLLDDTKRLSSISSVLTCSFSATNTA